MASIFTYDPDPPRVASPWLSPSETPKSSTPRIGEDLDSVPSTVTSSLTDYGVTRLEAEPQEGPTEYKLHLLLRPRRNYSSSSTGSTVSGSHRIQGGKTPASSHGNEPVLMLAPSNQSRQTRLEQLTTQLLWRLQQSSPYHSSSTGELILPKLPEATESLTIPSRPEKLLAGLEESRGALYEIGVSDDGTFVGLTEDEMNESLTNLRAMAASLGCSVEVVRKVIVGECEWLEHAHRMVSTTQPTKQEHNSTDQAPSRRQEKLWVAEALVKPDLSSGPNVRPKASNIGPSNGNLSPIMLECNSLDDALSSSRATEQLRVTLTGPTTSGKSSLLGTLSTATMDNGRGKSRLSLLKHRHEIETGVTSSVAQELIGYKDSNIINYAAGNVTSWTDIHASAHPGRLVFVSDTGGHPRYRRTTVRGLVGWAPHWTMLCIAADDSDSASKGIGATYSAQDILGTAGAGVDLAKAHLELCLKFEKPLVIVITKLDLASKSSLRQTLSKVLTAVKAAGRTPSIISPPDNSSTIYESDLSTVRDEDLGPVRNVIDKISLFGDLNSIVPIIMTSAAKGTGIRSMHALLQELPMPMAPTSHDFVGMALNPEQPTCLFHVEDVFGGLQASYEPLGLSKTRQDAGSVVAGYLRFGRLSVGDTVVLGPFPLEQDACDSPSRGILRSSPASIGASFIHTPNDSTAELSHVLSRNPASAAASRSEWFDAQIVSLRNLRLPVHTLEAGEVGTIGFVVGTKTGIEPSDQSPPSVPRIRKGMVMAKPNRHMLESGHALQAASGFTASFEDEDINSVTVGSLVVVYIASIRASARVLKLFPCVSHAFNAVNVSAELDDDIFGLSANLEDESGDEAAALPVFGSDGTTNVTLELITAREWMELGSQVLVMPGGGHGLYHGSERGEKGIAGLEGFVGRVIEVVD